MDCIDQTIGERFALYRGDCVRVVQGLPDDSIGYSVFSPPFASLYTYSDDPRDMGNCRDDAEFFGQFRFLLTELHRAMMPGRLVSIHCMDLPTSKQRHGVIGLRDFSGDIIRAMEDAGCVSLSRHNLERPSHGDATHEVHRATVQAASERLCDVAAGIP